MPREYQQPLNTNPNPNPNPNQADADEGGSASVDTYKCEPKAGP